ncbi:hypothetical protein tb265_22870 [Gemmatimonadetes bacterium T265]|nr:hypothetical protein tb265_22870 [Gemmatimonadetes bacterium T265]
MTGMGSGVSGLVSTVTQALTSLDPKEGANAIAQVRTALQGLPGTEAISGTLSSLHQQLTGGAPSGAEIGPLMTQLSQQTRSVSGRAGPIGGGLNQLADRLAQIGSQLSGGAA